MRIREDEFAKRESCVILGAAPNSNNAKEAYDKESGAAMLRIVRVSANSYGDVGFSAPVHAASSCKEDGRNASVCRFLLVLKSKTVLVNSPNEAYSRIGNSLSLRATSAASMADGERM